MKQDMKKIMLVGALLLQNVVCERAYASKCSNYCKQYNTNKDGCLTANVFLTTNVDGTDTRNGFTKTENQLYVCTCEWVLGSSFISTTTNACKSVVKNANFMMVDQKIAPNFLDNMQRSIKFFDGFKKLAQDTMMNNHQVNYIEIESKISDIPHPNNSDTNTTVDEEEGAVAVAVAVAE